MTEPQQKARRGCLFYGCIVGVVFLLMLLAGLLVGMHYAKKMITQITDSAPIELPTAKLSTAEMEQLKQRLNAFSDSIKAGKSTPPLELTSDEINALIADNPQTKGLKGKVYVMLQGDQVKSQISVPTDDVRLPFFKHRYLNGDATLDASLRNGTLRVVIQDINIKGKPLPSVYMQNIRQINWAEGASADTNNAAALNKIKSFEVKEGKVIITPNPPP